MQLYCVTLRMVLVPSVINYCLNAAYPVEKELSFSNGAIHCFLTFRVNLVVLEIQLETVTI